MIQLISKTQYTNMNLYIRNPKNNNKIKQQSKFQLKIKNIIIILKIN